MYYHDLPKIILTTLKKKVLKALKAGCMHDSFASSSCLSLGGIEKRATVAFVQMDRLP